MNLVLIRHARPERIDHDPAGADPGLTDLGHRQAAAMADYLINEPIGSIYVSPQRRARETATPLADALGLVPTIAHGVAEFDLGHPTYIPGEEYGELTVDELQGLVDAMTAPTFRARVLESFATIIGNHPAETIAVVCHGGVISTVLNDVLDSDPSGYFASDYTSVTRLRASRSGRRSLESFNECHWLRQLTH